MFLFPLLIVLELTLVVRDTAIPSELTRTHTAGVVFTPEPPAALVSAMEALWITVPFPTSTLFNLTEFDTAMEAYEDRL